MAQPNLKGDRESTCSRLSKECSVSFTIPWKWSYSNGGTLCEKKILIRIINSSYLKCWIPNQLFC